MLVLTRRNGQGLRIGEQIEVRVLRTSGDRVLLGINAPPEIVILRAEISSVSDEVQAAAATVGRLLTRASRSER